MKGEIHDSMILFLGQGDEICEQDEPVRQTATSQTDDKKFAVRWRLRHA